MEELGVRTQATQEESAACSDQLANVQREIKELRASNQTTQAELGACSDQLIEAEREMEELRAIIQAKDQELGDASQAIDALTEEYWQSNALRDNLTEELMNSKTRMETKISHQQEQIQILSWELNRIGFEREDRELLEPLAREVLRECQEQPCDAQLSRPGISQKE
jgi:chromosome segregation ATPase